MVFIIGEVRFKTAIAAEIDRERARPRNGVSRGEEGSNRFTAVKVVSGTDQASSTGDAIPIRRPEVFVLAVLPWLCRMIGNFGIKNKESCVMCY